MRNSIFDYWERALKVTWVSIFTVPYVAVWRGQLISWCQARQEHHLTHTPREVAGSRARAGSHREPNTAAPFSSLSPGLEPSEAESSWPAEWQSHMGIQLLASLEVASTSFFWHLQSLIWEGKNKKWRKKSWLVQQPWIVPISVLGNRTHPLSDDIRLISFWLWSYALLHTKAEMSVFCIARPAGK